MLTVIGVLIFGLVSTRGREGVMHVRHVVEFTEEEGTADIMVEEESDEDTENVVKL